MNKIIKEFGIKVGLILSIIQILITLYLYNYGSFVDKKIGMFIILLNIFFGTLTIILARMKLKKISLRESFTGYFITILISSIISALFYVSFFNTIASDIKKESIKKEFFNFQIESLKNSELPKEDINKNIELAKTFEPFTLSNSIQSAIKYLLIYSIIGIIISVIFRNKSSFQEQN